MQITTNSKEFLVLRPFIGVLYLSLVGLLSSCASYGVKYADDVKNWQLLSAPPIEDLKFSIYLIGDCGGAKSDKSTSPLLTLNRTLSADYRSDDKTHVIFLGDNIYPVGMPPENHKDRPMAEHKLDVQLDAVRDFQGNITFVPGNHDWYTYGREGLKRQEQYIEKYLAQFNQSFTDFFRPSDGCGHVDIWYATVDLAIVYLDSHWFLDDKPQEYDFSDCDIQNRRDFKKALQDSIHHLEGKEILVSMHHPVYTVGSHGGFRTGSSYIFPLKDVNDKLLIPLPLTGVVYNLMRPKITEQDTKSEAYVHYRDVLLPPLENHGDVIVATGHEHSLQFHQKDGISYVVSGSGSKHSPVGLLDFTRFASSDYGYALLDYYIDGTIWVTFYKADTYDGGQEVIYRQKIR